MKRCPTSLIIREIQIQTTMRYPHTDQNDQHQKVYKWMLERVQSKGNPSTLWGCKLAQPLWRTVWMFLKKLKIELLHHPAIPLKDISLEKTNLKRYIYPNVHRSTIYKNQDVEATKDSINRWTDKENVVYIPNGILLSHKKEWNNSICSNMDRPRDYTKWSQTKRNIWYHLYVESKKWNKWIYLQNRNGFTLKTDL